MKKIEFHVVRRRTVYLGIACILLLASVALVVFKGFNLGIDFESGVSVSVKIDDSGALIEDVRQALSQVEGVRVQNIGSSDDGRYQIRVKLSGDQTQRGIENLINTLLERKFSSFTVLESSFIGAKFSSSLVTGSLKAVAIALALILVYVWIRFKVAYAIGSILALIHDVVLMLGFISLVGFEISSTTIAAILTIIGYSLNNTIVIFDRVRESIRGNHEQELSAVMDYGVNSSLSRTTFSSVTTLLAVIPLAILSSGDVRSFAICMIFGVVVGTYSSNFLATNVLYMLGKTQALDILKQEEEEDLSDAAVARRMLGEEEPKLKKTDNKKTGTKKTDRNKGGNDPKILV
ncbi:MAG: protein translocase subunit SecF [Spirochaetales bacterium]|nr:protein translocase subunit SecF [Spirochaetales bacterium]